VIEQLLPRCVVAAETRTDSHDLWLFPEEALHVARAIESRRREFATTRGLARDALMGIGFAPRPIPKRPDGEPEWPAGVVGSITHCTGYRACAVARRSDLQALGIDAEPHARVESKVAHQFTRPEEKSVIRELARSHPSVCWDRLVFCAKEAAYKVWFPLTRRWLGFEDVRVTPVPTGEFQVELLVPGPKAESREVLSGRWTVSDGIVVAAIALGRPS
jgi:4'-phosphopantetheinyl transferase EntD